MRIGDSIAYDDRITDIAGDGIMISTLDGDPMTIPGLDTAACYATLARQGCIHIVGNPVGLVGDLGLVIRLRLQVRAGLPRIVVIITLVTGDHHARKGDGDGKTIQDLCLHTIRILEWWWRVFLNG